MIYTILFIIIAVALFWVLGLFIFSRMFWYKISKKYKLPINFYGKDYGNIEAKINGLKFIPHIQLKYNEEGFFLKPSSLYLFHDPVFIPWNDISKINKNKANICIDIIVGAVPETNTISVSAETYKELHTTFIKFKEQFVANY